MGFKSTYAEQAKIAVSSANFWHLYRPSLKRPVHLFSLLLQLAIGSAETRIHQEMSLKRLRKHLQTILDPSPLVFKGFARNRVGATEPSPTYGPLHGMKTANFIRIKDIATILPSHGQSPIAKMPNENATPQN